MSPDELWQFVFGPSPDPADVQRWHSQSLVFSDAVRFCLLQSAGGPCGVLAPLQALILNHLISRAVPLSGSPVQLPQPSDDERLDALIEALLVTLLRAAQDEVSEIKLVVMKSDNEWEELSVQSAGDFRSTLLTRFSDFFDSPFATLQVVLSLVFTKTPGKIKDEMDDPTAPLISRFGHCSQELVNLMLTGVASSNVFDGVQDFGEGFKLRGVALDRPVAVGYLTELEALNYVCVGNTLKFPSFPSWIIGSASHYTVLFGLELSSARVTDAQSADLGIKAAFDKFRLDEGIALEDAISEIFKELNLSHEDAATCRSAISQEGVVLFPDFDVWVKRKMGVADSDLTTSPAATQLYLLNGQEPPQLSKVEILQDGKREKCDEEMLYAILQTRWPDTSVRVHQLL